MHVVSGAQDPAIMGPACQPGHHGPGLSAHCCLIYHRNRSETLICAHEYPRAGAAAAARRVPRAAVEGRGAAAGCPKP